MIINNKLVCEVRSGMIRRFVKHCDMFAAPPLLRVRGEPELANTCGGVCSICVVILFTVIFVFSLIDLFKFTKIESSETMKSLPETTEIENLIFSIGIQDLNISSVTNIFRVHGIIYTWGDGQESSRQIDFVPCTPNMWSQALDYEYFFDLYEMKNHFCPQLEEETIYGGAFDEDGRVLYFFIEACDNATSSTPCADSVTIQAFMDNIINEDDYLQAQIFVMSTSLNTNEEEVASKFIDTRGLWLPFTLNQKIISIMRMGSYSAKTDVNFLPWPDNQVQNGSFLDDLTSTSFFSVTGVSSFFTCIVMASTTHRQVERKYGKIDDTLSYLGGLLGLLMVFFAFFMMSFNEYRYELAVAEGSISEKYIDGENINEHHMTFLKYLKYTVFDWVKILTGHECEWQDCQKLDQAREEGISQIDVEFLLHRIHQLEEVTKTNLSENEKPIFSLTENLTLRELKRERKILEYKKKIMKGKTALTINTVTLMKMTFDSMNQQMGETHHFQPSSNELNINSNNNFDAFNDSMKLVAHYLNQYSKYLNEFEEGIPELDEEEKQIQQDLATNFKNMSEEMRMKVVRKIPLPILNRIFRNIDEGSANFVQATKLKKNIVSD